MNPTTERRGWAVVLPSNRPERRAAFEAAWAELFERHGVRLFAVIDEPPWPGIPEFIPRRTDMIRSWGFVQAWRSGCRYVLSLDDDVTPVGDPFAAYERVFEQGAPVAPYLSVGALTDAGCEMRGFPYGVRWARVAVQYGGWCGVPDLDAATQITRAPVQAQFHPVVLPVPQGVAATTCAMNFAFDAEYTEWMWQLPLFEGRYNRFGDIWSGLIQKRVLDVAGLAMVVNGPALVRHSRASNAWANLSKEAPGMEINEGVWAALPGGTWREVTDAFANHLASFDPPYAAHFRDARDQWEAAFG
jgi:hypothetical protein